MSTGGRLPVIDSKSSSGPCSACATRCSPTTDGTTLPLYCQVSVSYEPVASSKPENTPSLSSGPR